MQAVREYETREVTTVEKVPVIHLTLTEEEAKTLGALCCRVGGGRYTYRKHTSEITDALGEAGIAVWESRFMPAPYLMARDLPEGDE